MNHGIRYLALFVLVGLALPAVVQAAGPALEAVPGPMVDTAGLPAPVAWPAVRHEQPLRLLAILEKNQSAAAFQRIARRMRATLELRYLAAGDDQYHVNDKWIEPAGNPTLPELIAASRKIAIEATAMAGPNRAYDVIFAHRDVDQRALQENLLRFMEAGGAVVVCGSVYPPADSALGKIWPAKPGNNSWTRGGAKREPGPALAGVPLEHLGGHTWIPIPSATAGSAALATGEAGAMFQRQVGKGSLLFVPSGPISRRYDAIATLARRYDHDEIWLRAWDQVLYTLAAGARAIPAYGDLQTGPAQAQPGKDYPLSARIVNRQHTGPLVAAVHVTTPQGKVAFTREETVELAPGSEKVLTVAIPVAPHWGAGLYPVYLTVADPRAKKQLHQAMELVPVTGALGLSLEADKRGYRIGEEARLTLTASSRAPWSGSLRLGVYDFRGRLVGAAEKAAQLTADKQRIPFTWHMEDHGVRADAFWVEVAAVADGKEYGRAEAKLFKYEPWNMRNEYQWSTWAGIACGPPSLVPVGMRLMAHAGMNALGYPGRSELFYPAERWGWRYYNEGVGMNTFSPVIEYENEAEIQQALEQEARNAKNSPDLTSPAFVLGSVGEEAGFKHGWGTRYYWDTPVAPQKACQAFRWFLREKYPDLAKLNEAWKTRYRTWDDVVLTKEFSARGEVKLAADGWAHPKESPLGEGVAAVSLAPYLDTAQFYDWYYDKIIDVARRILRTQINPVTLTMSSAPTIGSARYDVRLTGPGCWNESQSYSVMDGPEPGYGLIWGHFDWSVMTDNMFWGFLLTRGGHNNYWVDIPLMFNNDMTHTRASFAMRKWTHRLAGHERVILDSRPLASDIAVLGPNGLGLSLTPRNMLTSLQVAASQAGFGLGAEDPAKLDPYKVVFAVGRQAMTPQEAERLNAYVESGGTLVFTSRFANQTAQGVPQMVVPGCGLAEKWGLRVTEPTASVPQHHSQESAVCKLDGVGDSLRGLKLSGAKVFRERVEHKAWTPLAAYDDGLPAILTRPHGKGRLVFVNAMYQSHWYIQWVTPTGVERQGFFRLVEWLCSQANARCTLRIEGDLNQTLHVAVKQFTDPTGSIGYAILRTNGEVPWTAGTLHWLGPQEACYDVLAANPGQPAPLLGRTVPFSLQPGAGRLLAFVQHPVKGLRVTAQAGQLTTGQPLQMAVEILDAAGRPVPGSFPLELRVDGPAGEIAGLRRSFSAISGSQVRVATALNDPPGQWTITVTDGISGLSGSTRVPATAAATPAPGFIPWGQPSEVAELAVLSESQFVARLGALAAMYRKDHSADGWMTKQYLGYHYDFFPGTRHDLLRPLNEVDWTAFSAAIRRAVTDGAIFVLTGEDVGIHPGSGLSPYAHGDGHQLAALAAALEGAKWSVIARDGDTITAALGKGRVVLCRESIDAAGNTNPELARWQQRWLAETNGFEQPIPSPDLKKLTTWRTGTEPIAPGARSVTWFAGNQREIKLVLDPAKPLGETLGLILPPTGQVEELGLRISVKGEGPVRFEIGCSGLPDGAIAVGPGMSSVAAESAKSWVAAVQRYVQWAATHHSGPYRDGSGWRQVPIRVTAQGKAEVVLDGVKVVVR